MGAITDSSGNVIQTYATDEFGIPDASLTQGASSQPFGYTGEQQLGSGLVDLRARAYDPQLGRFLQRDDPTYLLQRYGATPQSLHGYAYVHNDPTTLTDPAGRDTSAICASGAIGLGAAVVGSVCPTWVNGEFAGVQGTIGFVGTTGITLSVTAGPQVSNANSVCDLGGQFTTAGASGGVGFVAGADVAWGKGTCSGEDITVGSVEAGWGGKFSFPVLPAEAHGGATWTGIQQPPATLQWPWGAGSRALGKYER